MTTTRPTGLYLVEFQVFYSTLVLFFVDSRLVVVKFSKIRDISKNLKTKDSK